MLISVVVPVFNRAERLRPTFESIAGQTGTSFEIVAVDDGSTDSSGGVLDELVRQLAVPMRVLRQSNAGPASARNLGISEAKGEIVVFVDSDDTLLPGALARFAEAFLATPAPIAAIAGQIKQLDRGRRRARPQPPIKADPWCNFSDYVSKRRPSVSIGSIAVSRRFARAHPFMHSLRVGEDFAFVTTVFATGPIVVIDEPSVEIDHRTQNFHISPAKIASQFVDAYASALSAGDGDERTAALRSQLRAAPYLRAFRECHRLGAVEPALDAWRRAIALDPIACMRLEFLRKRFRILFGLRHPANRT